ncbi:chondroitin-sulfate-ABC endolyase/exolyase [Bacillus pakistanensis]|uniref:Chondroitin-sulfate-ABC endolyase/exolyase n=1 Tax=Rossellomorea pakistanensis TaxID=992288 RepID=A0ABS2NHE6_9BACI|nr:chondroitinase family polysaccharide lyase [Bacillus pakistanensis]MBM7587296.1 chondroitin-sulfate-ABC endolyase/exolyase [Bacillus pakistanensis]
MNNFRVKKDKDPVTRSKTTPIHLKSYGKKLMALSLTASLTVPMSIAMPDALASDRSYLGESVETNEENVADRAQSLEQDALAQGIPLFMFENGVPKTFKAKNGGNIEVDNRHYKDGRHSLKWNYEKGSKLEVKEKIKFKPFVPNNSDQSIETFVVWVYNEEPKEGTVTFQFGRGNKADSWFEMNLNFSGWRTAWVSFERDMEGTPHPAMNRMSIIAPESGSGTLYFDSMMLSTPLDPRHHTPDSQVPFVNPNIMKSANAHWLGLLHFSRLTPPEPQSEVTEADLSAIKKIEDTFTELVFKKRTVTDSLLADIRSRYAEFGIEREGEVIRGSSLFMPHFDQVPASMKEAFKELSNTIDLRDYTDFMQLVADTYLSTDDEGFRNELKSMYINLSDHLADQGWDYGSGQGTMHHLGYNIRGLYSSAFLMRDVLREAGILERTQETLFWLSGAGRMYTPKEEVMGNIDILNTTLNGMLSSILVQENTVEKVRDMKSFTSWLSQGLRPAKGLEPAFKKDGSAYHHANHYPAYAKDAFKGVTPIVYVLSGTPYRIAKDAHETLKKALLSMRLYSNKTQWLISISGRHPDGKGALVLPPYRYMALAGSPDGEEEIDREVAAAYIRLAETEDATVRRFKAIGIEAEPDPNGFWSMNYANLGLHRRDNWLVGVKGYSRYLWGNETYQNANLYGRYMSYGQMQIMGYDNHKDSGYVHDGWDWNRWPGTTTIHLPFDQLKSDVRNVDRFSGIEEMLISDETYSGSLSVEGKNGMFAMKLHEHPKYDETHRARKSYFFFENRIVALGSNIENEDSEHSTETTLFQNHMPKETDPIWMSNEGAITEFPYTDREELTEDAWVIDNKGNGFFVPEGQTIAMSRSLQYSKHQKNGSDTSGKFATAWIDHGKAPKDGTYQYAVLVKTNAEQMKVFSQSMADEDQSPYTVLQQDRMAHIVKDRATGITGYTLFEANDAINQGIVQSVDTPSMVMTRKNGSDLILSVVDPDLRLYEGIEEDQYDENGVQKEVSIYSRTWRHSESIMRPMKLTIKGEWKLTSTDERVRILSSENGRTVLEFDCKDAEPMEIALEPK